jgi:PAS domain S-box-containing protein
MYNRITTSDIKFLHGGGEMGALIREMDWSLTPLGPVENWPQSLRTSVSSCLNSKFPILLWWGNELVKIYNDAYRALLSKKHPWALGKPGKEVWPEIWDIIGPMLKGVYDDGKATWAENQLLLLERDGYPGEYYFTYSYSPIFDESGGIGGVLCVVNETTKQVINTRRLNTLQQLSFALQQLPGKTLNIRAIIYPAAAKVLALNQQDFPYIKMYSVSDNGLSAESIIADGVDALPLRIDLDSSSRLSALCLEAVTLDKIVFTKDPSLNFSGMPKGSWTMEIKEAAIIPVIKADKTGAYGLVIAGLNPHLPSDDSILSFLNLISEQISTSFTNAIALEAERKRVQALSEIDEAKTTFFSNISHEFRTPLTLMLGPLEELMADPSMAQTHRDNIAMVLRNALRLQKLVNNLLDFSRLEAGRMNINYQQTDVAALTAQLASAFQSIIESSGMALIIKCPPIKGPVFIDREMWEKIVLNLLSNAFKYTLSGQIAVELTDNGEKFTLKVTDTGIGIPGEQINTIFQRFQRVQGANGRSTEGSGIGLSIVKELVNIMQGVIVVESQLGKGSSFSVTLPLVTSVSQENTSKPDELTNKPADYLREARKWLQESPGHKVQGDPTDQQNGKPIILLADDNMDMRNYLTRLLSDKFAVKAVANGRQAIESLREFIPELVISDVMMPDVDGYELMSYFKNSQETAHIPFILLSAKAGEEAKIEGLDSGADDYLIKPFSGRELISKIKSQLKIKQSRERAERYLHSLLMQAPAGICVLSGPAFVYELVNPLYQQLFPGRELLGKPLLEAIPEIKGQPIWDILQEVYHSGNTYEGRNLLIPLAKTGNGPVEDRYFDFIYQARLNQDNQADGILVYVYEVTEMVRARHRIEESEKRFRSMVEQAPVGLLVNKGDDLVFDIINQPMIDIIGRGDSIKGKTWFEAVPELVGQPVVDQLYHTYRTGKEWQGNEVPIFLKKNGNTELRYFNLVYRPLLEDGKITGLLQSAVDVTEQVNARKDLEQAKDKLELALSAAELGTFDFDIRNGYMFWDERCRTLFGISHDNPVSYEADFIGGLHPDDRERVLAAIKNVYDIKVSNGNYDVQYRTVGAVDRKVRWVRAKGKTYFDENGQPVRFTGAVLDITEQKTDEIRKNDFIGMVSHELKTPLTTLSAVMQIARFKLKESSDKRLINAIERGNVQIKRMTAMITGFLDIARLESGKMILEKQSFDIEQLLHELIDELRLIETKHEIDLAACHRVQVYGDRDKISSVISNLINNAVKYSPNGKPITISCERQERMVLVSVQDEGIGIKQQELSHVFDRFYRAETANSRTISGFGIGLYLSAEIIKQHNGEIWVESEPGMGSTFYFTLPI